MTRALLGLAIAMAPVMAQDGGNGAPATARTDSTASAVLVPAMGTWSFAPFVGGAQHSPAGYNWGITPDRDHFFMGVHMATPVLKFRRFTLMYAPNWVPIVVISNNPRYETVVSAGVPRRVESSRGPVYGTGLVPFGLQIETPLGQTTSFYSMAGLGGAWFFDIMPQDGARQFNFSIEFGGGLIRRARSGRTWVYGYKFHHFSNMYTARENPGVDGHVFYLGMRWQKRLPRE